MKAPALGIKERFEYKLGTITLAPGDCFFLYTDGVTEAMNVTRKQFTPQRLEQVLAATGDAPMDELIRRVVAEIKEFVGEAPQSDDITTMALRYRGPAAPT